MFDAIAFAEANSDPGLEMYHQSIMSAERAINADGGSVSDMYAQTLGGLDRGWRYHGHTATLSGRLYPIDPAIVDVTEGDWGEPTTDKEGNLCYDVLNVQLTSTGIFDVAPHVNRTVGDDGKWYSPAEFVYGFKDGISNIDEPEFYIRPADTLAMAFDEKTMEGINVALHHRWPKIMATVDRILSKDTTDPAKKLQLLYRIEPVIQAECIASDEFRDWIAKYLLESLHFDKDWPYLVELDGVGYQFEEDGSTTELVWKKGSRYYAKFLGIDIAVNTSSSGTNITTSLLLVPPSNLSDDEGSDHPIITPLTIIDTFMSTRAELPEKATNEKNDISDDLEPHVNVVSGEQLAEEPHKHPYTVEHLRLQSVQRALDAIHTRLRGERKTKYRSEADAAAVSKRLAIEIHTIMAASGLNPDDKLLATGNCVIEPNLQIVESDNGLETKKGEGEVLLQPNAARQILGHYHFTLPGIHEETDEEGKYWIVRPRMVWVYKNVQKPIVELPGVMVMATSSTVANAFVLLDKNADIQLPELERRKHRQSVMANMMKTHRGTAELRDLQSLLQAFINEQPSTYQDLGSGVKRIKRLVQAILEQQDDGLLGGLNAILKGQNIECIADSWMANRPHEQVASSGMIAEVVRFTDGFGREIVAAVLINEPVDSEKIEPQYAPVVDLATLSNLRF